jgi:hypothetical protein
LPTVGSYGPAKGYVAVRVAARRNRFQIQRRATWPQSRVFPQPSYSQSFRPSPQRLWPTKASSDHTHRMPQPKSANLAYPARMRRHQWRTFVSIPFHGLRDQPTTLATSSRRTPLLMDDRNHDPKVRPERKPAHFRWTCSVADDLNECRKSSWPVSASESLKLTYNCGAATGIAA